jgi:hypothetical protein
MLHPHAGADVGDGGIDVSDRAPIDDHRGAFTGEGGDDLFADASGGGGDEGKFVAEMEIKNYPS